MKRRVLILCALVAALVVPAPGRSEPTVTVITAPYTAGEACGIVSTPRQGPSDNPPALLGGSAQGGCTTAPPPPQPDFGYLAIPAQNGFLFHGGWAQLYFPPYYRGRFTGIYRSTSRQTFTPAVSGPLNVTGHVEGSIVGLGINPSKRLDLCLTVLQNGVFAGQDCVRGERPFEATSDPFRDLSATITAMAGSSILVEVTLEGEWDPGAAQVVLQDLTFTLGT